MKKLVSFLLFTLLATTANAQAVFEEIKQMAQKQVSDPHTSTVVKEINRFKVDALNYMGMKMKEEMPDSSAAYLDNQAYALYTFVNLYTKTLKLHSSEPQKDQLANLRMFIEASTNCPLFADKNDLDYVMSYVKNPDSPIRFSLDTNWIRAYLVVYEKLKR